MPDMQTALRARLLAAEPVTAIAGQRVTWLVRPQGSALPALTLQAITGERRQHLKGFVGARSTTVQIDSWAESYGAAKALIEAALAAAVGAGTFSGVRFGRATDVGEPRDLGEQTSTVFLFRQSVDLTVWHYAQEG